MKSTRNRNFAWHHRKGPLLQRFSVLCRQWFVFALALDHYALWLVKSKTRTTSTTNHDLIARVFPRLTQVTCICFELWLVHCVVCVCCEWSEWLLWSYRDTQLKTTLSGKLIPAPASFAIWSYVSWKQPRSQSFLFLLEREDPGNKVEVQANLCWRHYLHSVSLVWSVFAAAMLEE